MTTICVTSFHACTAGTFAIYMLFLGQTFDLETTCCLATGQVDQEDIEIRRQTDGGGINKKKKCSHGFKTIYLVTESPDWLSHGQVTSNIYLIDSGGEERSCR